MNGSPATANGSGEDEIDLREVWTILRRNQWLIAGSVAVVTAFSLLYIFLSMPVYQGETSIRFASDHRNLAVLDPLMALSPRTELGSEAEELRSRTLAESVVDKLGLQARLVSPKRVSRAEVLDVVWVSRTAEEAEYAFERADSARYEVTDRTNDTVIGTFTAGENITLNGAIIALKPAAVEHDRLTIAIQSFEKAVEELRSTVQVRIPSREASIVALRYQSTDTVLVRDVPNAFAQNFIERRDTIRNVEATSTVVFLRQQIDTISRELFTAEERLRDFREGHQVVSLEAEAGVQVQEAARLQAQRDQLEAERTALGTLLAEVDAGAIEFAPESGTVSSSYRRLLAFPSLLRNQAASELFRSLTAAESELSAILRRRTMNDPDAVVVASRIQALEEQLRSIAETYHRGLSDQIASLDETLARFTADLGQIPAKEVQFARLKRGTMVLEEIYTLLQTRLKEAEIAQAIEDASVRIIDPAITPLEPIKPRKKIILAIAMVLGAMLGVSTAFIREYMDTTIHTREDIQDTTRVPVLGLIPRIQAVALANGKSRANGRKSTEKAAGLTARLVTGHDPRNPVAEAYRSLRTNIAFSTLERQPKTLVFTSPTPGDGKSTTAANLAITLAQQGLKVLLIDADLRRGVLNTVFQTEREPGLSNIIMGTTPTHEAVKRIEFESSALHFISAGTFPPNPAELLGSDRMRSLIEALDAEYDAIILDAPPLNLVTDAALLGTNADGVLVVARASITEKAALAYAIEQLRTVRAPVLGAVLNDIDFKRDPVRYGAYGAYARYYGHEDDE